MKDLIEALTILMKYGKGADKFAPTHCEHDCFYVHNGIKEGDVSEADAKRLDELGFHWDDGPECWASYRFGSC